MLHSNIASKHHGLVVQDRVVSSGSVADLSGTVLVLSNSCVLERTHHFLSFFLVPFIPPLDLHAHVTLHSLPRHLTSTRPLLSFFFYLCLPGYTCMSVCLFVGMSVYLPIDKYPLHSRIRVAEKCRFWFSKHCPWILNLSNCF